MRPGTDTDRLFAISLAGLWCVSLGLPAVELGHGAVLSGWELARSGWRAALDGVPGWYANPLFFLSIAAALRGRDRLAVGLAAGALGTALTSFAVGALAASRGYGVPGLTWRSGFFVWLTAIAALLLWAALRKPRHAGRIPFGTP
jgi:hypothetical protein